MDQVTVHSAMYGSGNNAPLAKRSVGWLKGQYQVPDDFDTMGQDKIEAMFGSCEPTLDDRVSRDAPSDPDLG